MDFALSDEQVAIRDLAAQIFEGRATAERVKAVEAAGQGIDRELWAELARADLLGVALPAAVGGSGFGLVELCLVLEQQGRRVAPVPLLATAVMGALAVAEFGSAEQQARWLPAVVAGTVLLTAALAEAGHGVAPAASVTTARDGQGVWRLYGDRLCVPSAQVADRVLVPARAGDRSGVWLVDPGAPGVSMERAETTNREIVGHLQLDGAAGELLGRLEDGARIVRWIVDRAQVGIAALQLGVCEEALRQAAAYSSTRVQFGRPLSTFQGVALKAADAYMDTEAIRVTMWQAAWRLAAGHDAAAEVEVAAWWAADAGQRVVHATQHLHGGLGADVEYPVHRYFLWGKQLAETLGGASSHLAGLGRHIAASGLGS